MIERVAMLSVHTCPLAALGGKETGGMNVYVRELSRELGRRNIYVDAFTRSMNPEVPHIAGDDLGPNVRVIHVPAGPEHHIRKQQIWQYLPDFVGWVEEFVVQEGLHYDVYHSHYWLSAWVAWMLQSAQPAPIVHMFHTLGHMKNLVSRSEGEREHPQRIVVETEIMQVADRIVAATPRDKEQMLTLYGADPSHVVVIPPGVDLQLFQRMPCKEAKVRLGVNPDNHLILFVGRIEPLKGIDTLIEAVAILARSNPSLATNTTLCIVGGDVSDDLSRLDEEMRRLHVLRSSLGLEEMITFAGAQSQESLPCYYSASDVVVVPSHYESFGMVAVEAMACGAPVIASDVGGLSYIIEDGKTGYLVPDRDPEALAQRLQLLLTNPARRDVMSIQAATQARRYSWSNIASEIVDLYEQVAMQYTKIPILPLTAR
ncbi:MAG: glycosyltransferase family 1 protein [Chloroflexi bacterium]|nr:glycosyltransferase family 1 protein [Chloroflexota bacterium]